MHLDYLGVLLSSSSKLSGQQALCNGYTISALGLFGWAFLFLSLLMLSAFALLLQNLEGKDLVECGCNLFNRFVIPPPDGEHAEQCLTLALSARVPLSLRRTAKAARCKCLQS